MKLPFIKNLLNRQFSKEKNELALWNGIIDKTAYVSADALKQAKGNIPNCESRINELETALELINKEESNNE